LQVIIPWAEKTPGKKVLFMDNASCHFSEEVLALLPQHEIQLIPLPANSTHLTQPCDVAFFRPLKSYWKAAVAEFNENRVVDGLMPFANLPKEWLTYVMSQALEKYTNLEKNIKSAFRATGIYPLRPHAVINRECSKIIFGFPTFYLCLLVSNYSMYMFFKFLLFFFSI
jgi:hypothetical protein